MSDFNISINENKRITVIDNPIRQSDYDFPYGDYLYFKSFVQELNRVQRAILDEDTVSIESGSKQLEFDDPGDLLELDLYLRDLTSAKDAMKGIADKGLKAQINVLSKA
jgi:hypothetical protein